MNGTIETVRGMRDVLSTERHELTTVQTILETLIRHHGYTGLDLPIVEHRDLYLRKLGDDLVGKIYEFSFGSRSLALRPEWTASVLRAYTTRMQDQPLPLRFCYSGPVFRYERPQRSTYRQFTQVGVELIGAPAPRGDAEIVALACHGLDQLGIRDYHVRIGHIGLVREILMHLGLAERTRGLLLWRLERLRTQGVDTVRSHLEEQQIDLPIDPLLLEGMDDAQATDLLLRLLQAMQVNLSFGTRSPEAIVSRLVRKLRRDDPQPVIERALAFLMELGTIQGCPSEALPRVMALLENHQVQTTTLTDVQNILRLLQAHGISDECITLDFGLSRGLNYYTGLIFEIYDADEMQLCGGGRYDDLVVALGGQHDTPAIGFSYGLERVAAACRASLAPPKLQPEVLVIPVTEQEYPYAIDIAQRLRARNYIATVDVRGRSVANNLRDAARRTIDYVAIVGSDEQSRREVVWRDLQRREEERFSIDALPRWQVDRSVAP